MNKVIKTTLDFILIWTSHSIKWSALKIILQIIFFYLVFHLWCALPFPYWCAKWESWKGSKTLMDIW